MPKSAVQPLERPNVYRLTADRLIQVIAEEGLQEGDVIPTEREITERFGVGRSSVRESLRLLEAHSIIIPQRGGSYRVGERYSVLLPALEMLIALGGITMGDLHSFRRMIEVETVRLVARTAKPEAINKIREALREMIRNRSNPAAALEADLQFHVAISEATENGAFIAAIHGVRGALAEAVEVAEVNIDDAITQHQLILEAIIAKDEEAAVSEMEAHMDFVKTERHLP